MLPGLDRVKADIESDDFSFDINDEDIHMSVEKALTAEIGDAGARLHTAAAATIRLQRIRACMPSSVQPI